MKKILKVLFIAIIPIATAGYAIFYFSFINPLDCEVSSKEASLIAEEFLSISEIKSSNLERPSYDRQKKEFDVIYDRPEPNDIERYPSLRVVEVDCITGKTSFAPMD